MRRFIFVIWFCMLMLLQSISVVGQPYEFDRYVSGQYFDTYVFDGSELIVDLQDFTTQCDLFYISPIDGVNSPVGSQNIGNNQWKQFYRNVTVVPHTDIAIDRFYFNTHDNWQSFEFTFSLEGSVLECRQFELYNYNYRNYFQMDCDAALVASEEVNFVYQGQTPDFVGIVTSPRVYLHNGNNTAMHIGDCGILKADTLILDQSAQNNVLIDGHIIAEYVESDANLELRYDDAIVTIGEIPNNVKIYGGQNTTVNLCKNPSAGADKLGYFSGTILFQIDSSSGWVTTPSDEGDVNFNDNSGSYWVWKNNGSAPIEIGAYDGYESCMDEYINVELGILPEQLSSQDDSQRFHPQRQVIYNAIGQRIGQSRAKFGSNPIILKVW